MQMPGGAMPNGFPPFGGGMPGGGALPFGMSKPREDPNPNKIMDEVMSRLAGLGIKDITAEETNEVAKTYFQAFILERELWTPMPEIFGKANFIQIKDAKITKPPVGATIVADVMIDKSDLELEAFERLVTSIEFRGRSVVFYATDISPVDITIALKCVDANGTPVIPGPERYEKNRKR